MAVTSEPSPFTSVTASSINPYEADDLPIELKVPLPTSSVCSDRIGDKEKGNGTEKDMADSGPDSPLLQEKSHTDTKASVIEGRSDIVSEKTPSRDSPISSSPTMAELAHLVDAKTYHRHRALSAQIEVERLKLSCGLDKRLIATLSIAYGDMIDQYKTDDQAGFAGLYEACEQLKSLCTRNVLPFPNTERKFEETSAQGSDTQGQSSISTLPLEDQENITTFLSQIRTEQNFLADRISLLSPTELTALTSSYHPPGIDFSILQNHSHGKSQFFSRDSQMMKLSRRMDNLNWFHNQDPFFTLLYGVFDSAARPGSREYARRMEVWSATCAKTIVEGFGGSRPGSDELVIATLDAFANAQEWPLTPKVEFYLMDILAKGAFLLEPTANQHISPKESLETYNAKGAVAEADFFENALSDLFNLLAADDKQRAVPAGVLALARAILSRIEDPKLRLRAQQFITIRWYFATFLSSIAVYPEVRGIMMTQYIGETARRLVLQKLVVKMQEQVFDTILPRNDSALVNPRIREMITAIFQSFAPLAVSETRVLPAAAEADKEEASAKFLMITPLDIIGLVQSLYPERASSQGPTEKGITVSVSDRPSTAGSSTLVAGISDLGSAALTPTQSTTGDINPNELGMTERSVGLEDLNDASEGEPKEEAKAKEMGQQALELRIRATCQKLRDISARNRGSGPAVHLNAWAFVCYSEDGSTLSFKSNISKTADKTFQENANIPGDGEELSKADGSDAYHILKAEIIRMLQEANESSSECADMITSSKASPQPTDSFDLLESLMRTALDKAHTGLDFVNAHRWWRNLQAYQEYLACHPWKSSRTLLHELDEDLRKAVELADKVTENCEIQCQSLSKLQKRNKSILKNLEDLRNALRVKMWYVSDVRHSATYEEALYVTRALRTMASSRRPKQSGSISNWARQRLRGSYVHDRAEAQTLEAMVSPKEHCGMSKLADEQVELTSRWLTRRSIENFCKGEERIHRFCYEVQKSVGKLAGISLLESPVLWSSNLFKRERLVFDAQRSKSHTVHPTLNSFLGPPTPVEAGPLLAPSLGATGQSLRAGSLAYARSPITHPGNLWTTNTSVRQPTGLGLYGNQPLLPPTPTSPPMSWPNHPLSPASPLHAAAPSMPSNPSLSSDWSRSGGEIEGPPAKQVFAERIKKTLSSLLVSDLGYLLWSQGSETDMWVNDQGKALSSKPINVSVSKPLVGLGSYKGEARTFIGNAPTQGPISGGPTSEGSHSRASPSSVGKQGSDEEEHHVFPFSESYHTLLRRMSLTHDPYKKLELLYELETMIIKSMMNPASDVRMTSGPSRLSHHHGAPSFLSKSVPRTKTTSLEEVIANCTERRAGTMRSPGPEAASAILTSDLSFVESSIPGADDIVSVLYTIFQSPKYRPPTLFRDLQYITAFVPASTLDQAAQGKAFWDAGLAALALKEDLCGSLIDRANSITAYHMSPHTPLGPAADTALASMSLGDAANLWVVTAKEGSPIAARELGLFYLTHPELLPRVTMPFSKGKDVFRAVGTSDGRVGDKEKGALDPQTFAVVFHWMEIAANGGDKDARDFLKGNDDLSRGR